MDKKGYQVAEASNCNQYNLYIFQKSYKRLYRKIIKMGVGVGDDKIIDRNDIEEGDKMRCKGKWGGLKGKEGDNRVLKKVPKKFYRELLKHFVKNHSNPSDPLTLDGIDKDSSPSRPKFLIEMVRMRGLGWVIQYRLKKFVFFYWHCQDLNWKCYEQKSISTPLAKLCCSHLQ